LTTTDWQKYSNPLKAKKWQCGLHDGIERIRGNSAHRVPQTECPGQEIRHADPRPGEGQIPVIPPLIQM